MGVSLGSLLWGGLEIQCSLRIGMFAGGGIGLLRKELWRSSIRLVCLLRQHASGCCCWALVLGGKVIQKGIKRFPVWMAGHCFVQHVLNRRGCPSWGAVPCLLSLHPCCKQSLLSCCWSELEAFTYYTENGRLFSFGCCRFRVSGFDSV